MIKISNPEKCTGCLICEFACSFHHIKEFSRNKSSIKVNKYILNANRIPKIFIFQNNVVNHLACDLCTNEDYPVCILLCPEDVFIFEGKT